jgi:hypothetical protein
MTTNQKFEHTSVVLHVEKKAFALTSSDLLKGLAPESAEALSNLGEAGWELVSVVCPSGWGGATDSLLAFLKRAKA